MSDVKWTQEQRKAIDEKGKHILVAAAAGSGKTAVLVERIIHKVIDEKIDINKLLVVTFTNAAASEMRQRILDALYKKIDENPDDKNLQKQVLLLNKASICTIHAFCLEVIRNHFFQTDLSANFRVADETEIQILKQEILEDLFEEKYDSKDGNFLTLLENYTSYIDDTPLKELILNIYEYIQSSPFPQKWLNDVIKEYDLEEDIKNNFSESKWGIVVKEELIKILKDGINKLENVIQKLSVYPSLLDFYEVLNKDLLVLTDMFNNIDSWDYIYNCITQETSLRWPTKSKLEEEEKEIKEYAKIVRDSVKKQLDPMKKIYTFDSKEIAGDMNHMYSVLTMLKDMIVSFSNRYMQAKKERNIVDFHDIEHLALDLLVDTSNIDEIEDVDQIIPTGIAKKYQDKFEEIAIDEYQDSNLVQEYLLNVISKRNNIFMVGDVKQSIYGFRQARPQLFLEKYDKYTKVDRKDESSSGLKIQLFKNFRSRKEVLDITNLVFETIMSKELGSIEYSEEEFLNLGANYEDNVDNQDKEKRRNVNIPELHIIDLEDTDNIEDIDEQEQVNNHEIIEKEVLEAKYVADQIKKLFSVGYKVFDKKLGTRDLEYRDIVILLRSTSMLAPIYEKELIDLNFPVFSDTSSAYIESIEIDTIMSLLKIIDNPMQDIALVTVLRSPICGFTDNDLIQIRGDKKRESFYSSMKRFLGNEELKSDKEKDIKDKITSLFELLEKYRNIEKVIPLDKLIWQIYIDTGYYHYVTLMPNGTIRQANLKKLFEKAKEFQKVSYKGLFHFIKFIEKLNQNSGDFSSAKMIGENDDVIRIMSIHKSKGLEFPVVFLAATGKQFNLMDLKEKVVLDKDLGIGINYIDKEMMLEYPLVTKEAMKIKMKKETISEEMRILYVALTRAKEKLIITGVDKKVTHKLAKIEDERKMYYSNRDSNKKISPYYIEQSKSFLEWFLQIYQYNKEEDINNVLDVQVIKKEEFLNQLQSDTDLSVSSLKRSEEERQISKDNIIEWMTQNYQRQDKETKQYTDKKIEDLLYWGYPHLNSVGLPTKTSVTKIKEMKQSKNIEDRDNLYIEDIQELKDKVQLWKTDELNIPKFKEEVKLTGAQKGTLIHMCMQNLDEKKEYTKEEIIQMVEKMYYDELLTSKEKDAIDVEKIYSYTKSDLYKELKQAKFISKETPFYIQLDAGQIYEDEKLEGEKVLVQGIIDLYYINNNDELVLVDYKTDFVKENEVNVLIEKYRSQLELYKSALQKSMQREVDKVCIYSVYLNKTIEI